MYLFGILGGVLPDILRIIKTKGEDWNEFKVFSKYLVGTLFQMVIGALMVFLLKPDEIIDAVLLGFSGPQILTSLASNYASRSTSTDNRTMVAQEEKKTLLGFWRN